MSEPVTVPLWLLLAIAAFALWSLVDRLLMPSARWLLRRRLNRLIDTVNRRLAVEIKPFQLTKRQVLIDRLVYDSHVVEAANEHARADHLPRDVVMAEVRRYAREIVPAFNAYVYFRIGYALARALAQLLYRVRLGFADAQTLAGVAPGTTVVFVMNHRSNMDYVLVAFLAAERTALSYAVGEWARIWPLQQLIRSMGAYFVRRNSNNPVYRRVLERYVHMATEAGVAQAMYPEGGLSRDGRLREPKLGLYDYMLKSFDPAGAHDIVFVPVALNYDRVLEDRTLLRSLDREAARRGVWFAARTAAGFWLGQLWLMLTGRWYRFGYACVNFGRLVSARDWLAANARRPARSRQGAPLRDHRPPGGRRDGAGREPRAGAAGIADRDRPARSRGSGRRVRAQAPGGQADGRVRGARRQALRAARRPRLCDPCRPAHAGAASSGEGARGHVRRRTGRASPARLLRQFSGTLARTMIDKLWRIFLSAFYGFFTNRLSTSAAAIAFYTMFALGPIMIFAIAIAEPFVGKWMAEKAVLDALGTIVDPEHLRTIERFAQEDLFKGGGVAAIIGASVLIYTGSRIFVELDDSFDVIWRGSSPHSVHPVLASIRSRLLALLMMVILGVLLIAVIVTSVALSAYAGVLQSFPGAGRVDRPGDLRLHPLRPAHRVLHPDLQVAADRRRAMAVRPAGRRRGRGAVRGRQPGAGLLLPGDAAHLGVRRHRGLRRDHGVDVLDRAHHPDRRPGRPLDPRRAHGEPPPRGAEGQD